MNHIFLVSILLFVIVSCNTENKSPLESNPKKLDSRISYFDLKISDDDSLVRRLPLYGFHEHNKGNNSFISYYDKDSSQIITITIENALGDVKKVSLNDEILNINEFDEITSFQLVDSLLVFFQINRIGIYNLNTDSLLFDKRNEPTDEFPYYFEDYFIPVSLDPKNNEILLQTIDYSDQVDSSINRQYIYDVSFHSRINYLTNEFKLIPVKFPTSFNNGELGLSAFVNSVTKGDSIIYNFSVEDSLVLYTKSNDRIQKILCKSKFDNNELAKLKSIEDNDVDRNRNLKVINFLYEDILYDKWRKYYYRLYSKSTNLNTNDGLFNTYNDKERGVIVMDSTFSIIGEINLPTTYVRNIGVSKSGIYYMTKDTIFDNLKNYVLVTIEENPNVF